MRFFKPTLAVLLLVISVGCSKSTKTDTTTPPDPSAVKLKTGEDPNKVELVFPKDTTTCQKFFTLVHWADKSYLANTKVAPIERLQIVVQEFSKYIGEEVKVDTSDIQKMPVKDNDCSPMNALAEKLKNNKDVADFYGETPDEFDSLRYVFENIMEAFAHSYDRYCSFDAPRYSRNGTGASVASGLRLLNRIDYDDVYVDGKVTKPGRKPPYLYVMYSPDYLSKIIPKYSRISKINDKVVAEQSFYDSLRLLSQYEEDPETKQAKKIKIEISIWDSVNKKPGDPKTIEVQLKNAAARETDFELVSEKPRIGYMHIASFNKEELDVDFLKTWIEYLKSNEGQLDGTIIDLRGNPGGMLYETQKILETILPEQRTPISYTINRQLDGSFKGSKSMTGEFFPIDFGKIVILTNNDSASASEMFTAALQDYKAALVVGESTYGKGIGQKGIEMDDDHLKGTLHITNFYVFSPMGRTWYLNGLQPDIAVTEKANDGYFFSLASRKKELPPLYPKELDLDGFDVTTVPVHNQVTSTMIDYLKTVQADANEQPAECVKSTPCTTVNETGCMYEEQSCVRSWGIKLLQKWIEKEPAVQKAE